MDYEEPAPKGFTVYTKSGCLNCPKVKSLLKDKELKIVECDEYLFENRDDFLSYMRRIAETDVKMFPMVFNDGKFVGGYNETKTLYNTLTHVLDEMFNPDVNF